MEMKLQGSEKQVAWAMDIINNVMGTINANIDVYSKRYEEAGVTDDLKTANAWKALKPMMEATFAKQTSAKWFIDKRYNLSFNRLVEAVEMIKAQAK